MRDGRRRRRALAAAVLMAVLTGCGGGVTGEPPPSTPSATPSATPGVTVSPFPSSDEPVAIEAGDYRIPISTWSVADFMVTFPKGWEVQYGHVYAKHSSDAEDAEDEFGFYAVVVDELYADACAGETGDLRQVGPGVDDLAAALLKQPGPKASGPVETTLGGYPAVRIDLVIPESYDLTACSLASFGFDGLQVWYSPPADKYFVLLPDATASVYIVDVDGQRQVFLTQSRSAAAEDARELQAVLDSIRIET